MTWQQRHRYGFGVRTRVGLALCVALAVPIAAWGVPPAQASPYAVTEFARVSSPGHPFGVLSTDAGVFVTTAAGNPHPRVGGELLFRFDGKGRETRRLAVPTAMPDMGLFDLALDGEGRLCISDMNGRVFRVLGRGPGGCKG